MARQQKKASALQKTLHNFISQKQEKIQARQLASTNHKPMRLKATDNSDLKTISALLQDAIVPATNFHYDSEKKVFSVLINRFCWEESFERLNLNKVYGRISSHLSFQNVKKVQHMNMDQKKREKHYELLTIQSEGKGEIQLIFAGKVRIKLSIDDIRCLLTDLDDMWYTIQKPKHHSL